MRLRNWEEVVTADFPTVGSITQKTIFTTGKEAHRFRGSMRVSTGRIWESRAYEKYRAKVLNSPLR